MAIRIVKDLIQKSEETVTTNLASQVQELREELMRRDAVREARDKERFGDDSDSDDADDNENEELSEQKL